MNDVLLKYLYGGTKYTHTTGYEITPFNPSSRYMAAWVIQGQNVTLSHTYISTGQINLNCGKKMDRCIIKATNLKTLMTFDVITYT